MSIKISQLSSSTSVTGSDLIVTVTSGSSSSLITAKSTIQQVFNYITSTITDLTLNNITVLDNTILGNSSSDYLIVSATAEFLSDLSASNVLINNNLIVSGNISGTNIEATSFTGSRAVFSGDVFINGILTVREYHSEVVSASMIYESGSTKFGNDSADAHQFTGSILLDGQLTASGNLITAQNLQVNGGNIDTVSTTVNLFTSSANNINIGTSASSIFIGSYAGNTNVNNSLLVSGSLHVTGTAIVSGNLSGTTSQFQTITGSNITGTIAQFGVITGSNISGITAQFGVITGSNISGTTAQFGVITGSSISGTTAYFTTITSSNISGSIAQYQIISGTNVTGTLATFVTITGSNISGSHAHFEILTSSNISAANISSSLYVGDGSSIVNLTASNIVNFIDDVRGQFSAGSNITIVSGVISSTGGGLTGSFSTAVNTVSSSLTLDNMYHTIYADALGGNITITLPAAATYNGIEYIIKKVDTSLLTTVTISGSGGELIDGYSHIPLDYRFEGITVQSDGTSSWFINADVSSEITLIAQGYINPIGTNNLYILTGTSAGGDNTNIQFNDAGILSGSSSLTFNKVTNVLSGTTAEFTYITASIISASQYIGIIGGGGTGSTPGGTNQSVQFNSGSQLSGTSNLIYNYNTNTLSGTAAQFTNLTASIISASQYFGLPEYISGGFNIAVEGYTSSQDPSVAFVAGIGGGANTTIQFNESGALSGSLNLVYNKNTGVLSGTLSQFTVITASIISASQYVGITGGSGIPGGTDQAVQFNSGSTFSGSTNLIYNYTTNTLSGTTAQFTTLSSSNITASVIMAAVVTGSVITGSTALFTTITGTIISARLKNLTTFTSIVSVDSTLSENQHIVLASASVSNLILTLPSASISAHRQYVVKKIDPTANKIIISGSTGQTIDGNLGREIGTQYETVTLVCDGISQWYIL